MKHTKNHYTEEQAIAMAFAMYKETVSPPPSVLVNVLNHIPEKKKITAEKRQAIRSPYIWHRVAQCASVFVILFAIATTLPTQEPSQEKSYSFYDVDSEIASFEEKIQEEDYQMLLSDYTL